MNGHARGDLRTLNFLISLIYLSNCVKHDLSCNMLLQPAYLWALVRYADPEADKPRW